MTVKILIPLAEGFEEIEAITIIDILRRAEIKVVTASLEKETLVKGGHNIYIKSDETLENIKNEHFDGIALPGGMGGMLNLKKDERIISIIKNMYDNNLLVAAVCASPVVLSAAGVIKGNFTCYPGMEKEINSGNYIKDKIVVVNKNIITSQGPATAMFFALEIVKYFKEENNSLKESLLVPSIINL